MVATGLKMISFHPNLKEGQCKKYPNYCTIVLVSHVGKVMLKILKARLAAYVVRTFRCRSWVSKRQRNTT